MFIAETESGAPMIASIAPNVSVTSRPVWAARKSISGWYFVGGGQRPPHRLLLGRAGEGHAQMVAVRAPASRWPSTA